MAKTSLDSKRPKICLSLTEPTLSGNLAVVDRERERVDVVELRADFLEQSELAGISDFPRAAGLPAILTFRRSGEGGARPAGERERVQILDRALQGEWSFVDLEEDLDASRLDASAASRGITVIRSFHDFGGVPSDLAGRLERLPRSAAEVPKAAVMPHSAGELGRILAVADSLSRPAAILVGMGDWGFPTRAHPSRFSSALTYCTSGKVKAAPGHVEPQTLRDVYRIGETRLGSTIYCVVGNPVLHSRSPWIHNPGFRALGMDAVYFPLQTDRISDFASLAEGLPVAGASITVPHKEAVREMLSSEDPSVAQAGACNTIVREGRGWRGYNTDIAGFMAPLSARLKGQIAGRSALVIGAGGAARAVVAGLKASGCTVTVVNRTSDRAAALASQFGCEWISMEDLAGADRGPFSVIVQATSGGMTPNEDVDPVPALSLRGSEIVYELIYAPPRTRFARRAEEAGCQVIGGGEMLLEQAYMQFRLFTGRSYPPIPVAAFP